MKNKSSLILRKTTSFFLVIIFLSLSFGVNASTKNSNLNNMTYQEQFFISKPKFTDFIDFISIDINEAESSFIKPGRPMLPVITKVITFPLGTRILNTTINFDTISYCLSKKIMPCPQFSCYNKNQINLDKYENFVFDEIIYNSNELYPNKPYNIHKCAGLLDGKHVLIYSIKIIPQYNPGRNIIFIPEKIDINIEYISNEKQVLNYDEQYDMVIISPEEFSEEIKILVDHKNDVGVTSFLKTTEEIYSEYIGCDKPEQIKYFIKDAIENYNVKYVLLIGDIYKIPMRKTALSWEYFGNLVVPDVITDLYYSDIYNENGSFSTWDSNHDGIFSEIRMIMDERPYNETLEIIDIIDGAPDVVIGRLPCSNINDVRNNINKIITYETTSKDKTWFNRLILMGGDTFPNVGGINEGEYVNEYISSVLSDFIPIKLWTSLNTFRPLKINLEISKGAGFVSYSGHGFQYGFGTYEPDSNIMKSYNLLYTLGIFNGQKYPIIYFDACLTACLDYKIYNIINAPCFAWTMVKKHFGGAIATIGATRVGFGGFEGDPFIAGSSCLHRYFFEAYEPGINIGDMFIKAKIGYIENVIDTVIYDPLTIQEFTLLGDPSLKVGGYQ